MRYLEKLPGRARSLRAVGDFRVVDEIIRGAYGDHELLDGEESGQVGGVGRDDDEGEEPPG